MPHAPTNDPTPTMEWLARSTHGVVSDTFNMIDGNCPPTVVLEGLKGRKKPVLVRLVAVPRVGDSLWFGRPGQAGRGKYRVLDVEWFVAQEGYAGEVGYAVVRLGPTSDIRVALPPRAARRQVGVRARFVSSAGPLSVPETKTDPRKTPSFGVIDMRSGKLITTAPDLSLMALLKDEATFATMLPLV